MVREKRKVLEAKGQENIFKQKRTISEELHRSDTRSKGRAT